MCYECLPVVKVQLYCNVNVFIMLSLASHIDTTALKDGTYELIPDFEEGDPEVQVNAAVLTEDPDQSSEESKAVLASDYREGKPRT